MFTRFLLTVGLLCIASLGHAADEVRVRLDTSHGDVLLELDPARAPATVENFLNYVRDGFYDGTVFHRVIPGFMVQGGGFTAELQQKPTGAAIRNEADNGLRNTTGSIAMARTADPHSATAQFFINVADNDFLDHRSPDARGWGYAVFGRVIEGMQVVERIVAIPTVQRGPLTDLPGETVTIERATIEP